MGKWTSLTSRGQVRIYKEIREHIGLEPFDKVQVYRENGETKVRTAFLSLGESAGIVPPLATPFDDAGMTTIVTEDWVER